ncbi:MAG TPA: GMC family oxidoreductase [Myxococcales bacterium]|nr:GMC family oxidoreductase [Myxococcales bacterium]HIM02060.1 GMC family oxidoreductase [Myxococcales bacterium]
MSVSARTVGIAPECLRVFTDYDADFELEADAVVVGSGPCGAVVAHSLAEAGHSVVLLEEGPPFTPRDFEFEGSLSMARTLREGGLRSTSGTILPTMQAIALGGGSLVNSAICVRPPEFVFEEWSNRFDLEHTTRESLDPHFDAVADFLGIAPTPDDVQGRRNLLMKEGCDALGYSSEPIARNVRGCRGSGECFTGCRARAKQSMDISYIPEAMRHGAKVLTSVQVQGVLSDGRRATGIEGQVVEPFTGATSHRFRVKGKVVVLAAGCMATPILLQRSDDMANKSGQVGNNLQFHPGVAIAGIFPDIVNPQFGATQGYQSLEFLKDGFKLESLWAPPAVAAVRMPGFGKALLERFADLPYLANWDAIGSTHRSVGTVRPRRRGLDPNLHWNLHPEDVKILTHALWVIAEILFAAGARKIIPGVIGLPAEMYSLDEARVFQSHPIRARDLVSAGNHAFCTTRMHGDASMGVVNEFGRCHDFDNLYITDTGIFPRCPSVNPMFTGMALAHRASQQIIDAL